MNDAELKKLVESVVKRVLEGRGGARAGSGLDAELEDRPLAPDPDAVRVLAGLREHTPARIGLWRTGTRYKTAAFLKVRADHAVARDAVRSEVDPESIRGLGFLFLESGAANKEEFLINPALGRGLSDESAARLEAECIPGAAVQIVVCDGLSSTAVEANIGKLFSTLLPGLERRGLKLGTLIFVNNGRVAVQDQIGDMLKPRLALGIVGERPGLATAESLGAYLTFNPSRDRVEAERNMVSNIHGRGTPPERAGEQLAELAAKILDAGASGVNLKE